MGKRLTANAFSAKSLKALQKELEKYKDSLQGKMEKFIALLLDEGVRVAREISSKDTEGSYGTHKMANHAFFEAEPIKTTDGVVYGIMIGSGDDIVGEWYTNDGNGNYVKQKDVINALMALEFGTAAKALPAQESFGVLGGQGTFPALYHGNDCEWHIITKVGVDKKTGKTVPVEWKPATAITPTRPMYNAGLAMYQKVKQAAIEVFRS